MAAKKISQLPDAATVTGADLIPIVQGGATVKVPASGLPVSAAAQAALDLVGSRTPPVAVAADDQSQPTYSSTTGLIYWMKQPMVDPRHPRFGAVADNFTDAKVAIQAAEDFAATQALARGCGVLLQSSGRFAITGSINKKAGVHWMGRWAIRRKDNAAPLGSTWALVLANTVHDWSIKGVELEAVRHDEVLSVPLTVSTAVGSQNSCIEVYRCDDWSITECKLRKFDLGILYRECKRFRIKGNDLRALTSKTWESMLDGTFVGFSVYIGTGGIYTQYVPAGIPAKSVDGEISGNYVEVPGLDVAINVLDQAYDEQPINVFGNIIRGCNAGIQVYRGSFTDPGTAPTYSGRSSIRGNHIYVTWEQGIYIRSTIGVSVVGNRLWRAAQNVGGAGGGSGGAIVTRANPFPPVGTPASSGTTNDAPVLIADNYVLDTGRNGVVQDGAIQLRVSAVCRGNVVTRQREVFTDNTAANIGIYASEELYDFIIDGNVVHNHKSGIVVGNIRRTVAPAPKWGNWSVSDNRVSDTTESAISVSALIPGGRIAGNSIRDCRGAAGNQGAINVRFSPHVVIEANNIADAARGIVIASGCLSSDGPYCYNSAPAGAVRRGGSVVVRRNRLNRVTVPYLVTETSANDASFHGRCAVWDDDTVHGGAFNGQNHGQLFAGASPPSTATARTWSLNDVVLPTAPAAGGVPSMICTSPGTYGDAATTTGDTTSGSATVANIASLDGLGIGVYVTLSGVAGVKKIKDFDVAASSIVLDVAANATVVGSTIAPATPTFIAAPKFVYGSVVTLASAASVALNTTAGNVFRISGTTTIDNITNGVAGQEVTLLPQASHTYRHFAASGNLRLAGGVDFAATISDTLTLVYDGATWYEKARTVI